ncbi:xanthine dehydrogenase 1-like [Spodoptera litura]|uniref:Xanthine dehydrogenase 1-like n=1 Tax=Spodoptera litura TaxID=69820 RepID=A0A9J7EA03_SPOLT|nr:xanthine dehydrogenase 1-like [Spodoptera litura]
MDVIKFKVNGVEHTVSGSEVGSDVMLLDYLRNYLQLRGTKYSCREGGCGACMITAAKTPGAPYLAVNACLQSLGSCHGWDIVTIEGLGNKKDGYHPLQTTLAENHGTQCGYCTPGWVMAMHGLMESNNHLTMLDIEKSLSSNLCRCTGYRPILDSFKKFAVDAPTEDKIKSIKDLSICKKSNNCCRSFAKENDWCMVEDDVSAGKMMEIKLKDGKTWYTPTTLNEVLKLLEENLESYMLVGGNTSKGAYPILDYANALIDVNHVQELKANDFDQNLRVGAGLTMTELMDIFKTSAAQENFSYLSILYDHVDLVAHIPLRNVATVAGNLMIKHTYNSYQSDMYLIFYTVGAQLTIVDYHGKRQTVTMNKFLEIDMKGKVILDILLPPLSKSHKLYTYKLMPRAQSSHAIVNAGFLFKLNSSNVVEEATIVYGALSEKFEKAVSTERYLIGRDLFSNDTLQGALKVLDGEMIVEDHPPEPSIEYRRHIAKALFFKALLNLAPSRAPRCDSAVIDLHLTRQCSKAKQVFSTDTSLWPVNKPMPKLEAKIQCAGEAIYTDDMPSFHNEVFGSFVLSTVGLGTILKMDPSEALALPGVLAFYTYKDIPGLNSFTPSDGQGGVTSANEEILCEGDVKYNGQPIGIIVAETQNLADRAARLVKVKYTNICTPITDIKVAKEDSTRNTLFTSADATTTGSDVHKIITGSNVVHGQYHFPMETMVSVVRPTEEGLEVHLASQWMDGAHTMISRALKIDQNKIDVYIRRVGGSYGLKISRCIQSAVACSLIVQKLNRPCRFIQPLITNLKAFGKRMPNVTDYEVAVNSSGILQYVNLFAYTDNGYKINEPIAFYAADVYFNCYDGTKFNYKSYNTITDTAKNTYCRAPGTLEAIANIENIMERISYELSLDPIALRLANLNTNYSELAETVEALKTSAEYTSRRAAVDSFNTKNKWKKRGLRWAFCRFPPVGGLYADVNLSVYHSDGTIVITHGGIEMGQGINTKAAQVAAYLLNVPVELIEIKGNNSIIAPNSFASGGSITTEGVIVGLRRCIEQLQARLEPIKATMTDPTWLQLITAAFAANVDLQVHGYCSSSDAQAYEMFSAACCEVEVDVLTGEYEILRVDIMQDVGISMNPDIDIGQIEGAFMMASGYWTCEKLVYDSENGALLTDRSWDYHLPEARDIPQDFRVTLKNSYSHDYILGSKGIGEPPACLSVVVPFALREAIVQARQESGIPTTEWFDIEGPFSTEKICMAMKTSVNDFKIV